MSEGDRGPSLPGRRPGGGKKRTSSDKGPPSTAAPENSSRLNALAPRGTRPRVSAAAKARPSAPKSTAAIDQGTGCAEDTQAAPPESLSTLPRAQKVGTSNLTRDNVSASASMSAQAPIFGQIGLTKAALSTSRLPSSRAPKSGPLGVGIPVPALTGAHDPNLQPRGPTTRSLSAAPALSANEILATLEQLSSSAQPRAPDPHTLDAAPSARKLRPKPGSTLQQAAKPPESERPRFIPFGTPPTSSASVLPLPVQPDGGLTLPAAPAAQINPACQGGIGLSWGGRRSRYSNHDPRQSLPVNPNAR